MALFALVVAGLIDADAQTSNVPARPKYKIMGVVYAPPGSASSVTYGNSDLVGSTDTMATTHSTTSTQTIGVSVGTGIPIFSVGVSYQYSDGWTESQQYGNSISIQTTHGNSISTMGPISSALGVDHDNDVIYIWLNPVLTGSSQNSTSGGVTTANINWTGLASNSCDPDNPNSPMTIDQAVGGCDPNQYPYPDIVGIPVWCLKNPFNPDQGCAQWLPYTTRSWDKSDWGTDPNTGLPLGPGLTMRDYADILQADPFVVMNGSQINVCHPTYGPDLDPNLSETIAAPLTPSDIASLRLINNTDAGLDLADPYDPNYTNQTTGTGFFPKSCGASDTTMNRFQPYGTVEYPVPGPNGLPSTYSGTFQYSQTATDTSIATDTHTVAQSESVSASVSVPFFNASVTDGFSNSATWEQQSSSASTSGSTSSAAYSITGPQLTDNYTGPATYNVYLDNIYGTFAFYSDLTEAITPTELGNIGISTAVACSPSSATPCLSFPKTLTSNDAQITSASQTITLTSYSKYPVTMASPAVTFSDPGFQIVAGSDSCSNQVIPANTPLNPFGSACQLSVVFSPVPADAPNTINGATTVVNANMVTAGTVNGPQNQSILVTNYATVRGIAEPNASLGLEGATLRPVTTPQNPNYPNAYFFPTAATYTQAQTEQFVFTNYSNSSVTFPAYPNDMSITDNSDFAILNTTGNLDGCAGKTIAENGTCKITLQFFPTTVSSTGVFTTRITAIASNGAELAEAGATGNSALPLTVTTSVVIPLQSDNFNDLFVYGWAAPVMITNNTQVPVTLQTVSTSTPITDPLGNTFHCEPDAGTGNGNAYFSSCVYNSSANTNILTPQGTLANTTDTLIPQPWGYVFGQLSGNFTAMENAGHGCPVTGGCTSSVFTPPALSCSTTGILAAGQSCTAAIAAYLPPSPDDQGWDYEDFANGVKHLIGPDNFVATFSVPLTATFNVVLNGKSTPISFSTEIPVTVKGCNQSGSVNGCVATPAP